MDQRDHFAATVSRKDLLVDGTDDAFRAMVHNLLAFSGRLEQIRSRFGAMIGLSGIQFTILISIRQLQGGEGVGVKALADHLAISAPFITTETTKLAKLDLVTKKPNPQDQRRVHLRVSPKGARLLADVAPVQQEVNDLLFEPVTESNFAQTCALAASLRKSAEKAILLSDYLIGSEREGQ